MRSHSLLHHTAWQTAVDVIRSLPGLTDAQRRQTVAEVYASVRKGLDYYVERAERMAERIGGAE